MATRITALDLIDVRFPTSEELDGSDATNRDPDYSAAYITIETDSEMRGYALIFTIGRGTEICCQAVQSMAHLVVGWDLDDIKHDIGAFYRNLRSDSQLQWLGPERGVIHMAVGGIVNAVWDLWARSENKPVWRLLADMGAEQLVACLDFRYISDALSPAEALDIIRMNQEGKLRRIEQLLTHGYPAYTTSAGWLGYSDEKLVSLCKQASAEGFRHLKLKVGLDLEDDRRRCGIARSVLGPDAVLMIDANQRWEVAEAIDWVRALESVDLWFIEEPTSPDDVFGHRRIRAGLHHTQVATGEHCQNRVMFKQLIANDAIDVVQVDACRLAGLNEVLTVYMLAAKYGKPVCPHAGGVGLCEYVQHLSFIDYVQISGEIGERVIEYVDHLHEHFVDPCVIRKGRYLAPLAPGFSIEMKPSSLRAFSFPDGDEWVGRRLTGK